MALKCIETQGVVVFILTDNKTTPTKVVFSCFGLLVGLWQLEADTSSNNANYLNVKEELPETIIDDQMKVPYSLVHADTFNNNENDLTAIAEQVTKLEHEVGSLKMDKQELIRHNTDVQGELNK